MFLDRDDAGRQLVQPLKELELHDPVVLALPRGGVPVGAALAEELGAELDVVLSRKLRAPGQPELAIGAVGEDGHVYLNSLAHEHPAVTEEYLEQERQYQLSEIARRQRLFRAARAAASVEKRSVILTDDGIATGSTMIAALNVVRNERPNEVIVAVPVGPPRQLRHIRPLCDRLVCLQAPEEFWAIGQFYENFEQVDDSEVVELLQRFAPAAQGRT